MTQFYTIKVNKLYPNTHMHKSKSSFETILSTVCSWNFRYFYDSYRTSSHKPKTITTFL